MRPAIVWLVAAGVLGGCAGPNEDVQFEGGSGRKVTQIELQQEIQRFVGSFNEGMTRALLGIREPGLEPVALRQALLYGSSALDIATGPVPEVNLLDMVAFVRLSRKVVEAYWIPEVFGPAGSALLGEFERSEAEILALVDDVMAPARRQELLQLIDQWHAKNPERVRVEGLRLSQFARMAGDVASAQRHGGLLSGVKNAVEVGDQAVLLGNRALFLANRMPFLVRLQARLGAREITTDLMPDPRPLLRDLSALTRQTERLVATLNELVLRLERLSMWRAALALLAVGLGLGVFWWAGYFVVKRALLRSQATFAKDESLPRAA
jgi:hypothetical protein